MNAPDRIALRAAIVAGLLACPTHAAHAEDPNRGVLASVLAGFSLGQGCLPDDLGLSPAEHTTLMQRCFPATALPRWNRVLPDMPEKDDLRSFLLDHRAGRSVSECWLADILVAACGGQDHLWQDLGLANRTELGQLMHTAFPALAQANHADMKWKKFIYRQLCERDGIYICPAPSCGVCVDYAKCFGPEN